MCSLLWESQDLHILHQNLFNKIFLHEQYCFIFNTCQNIQCVLKFEDSQFLYRIYSKFEKFLKMCRTLWESLDHTHYTNFLQLNFIINYIVLYPQLAKICRHIKILGLSIPYRIYPNSFQILKMCRTIWESQDLHALLESEFNINI